MQLFVSLVFFEVCNAVYSAVPDIVPIFDETFKIFPDGVSVLTVQVYQVEVVGVVNRLIFKVADAYKYFRATDAYKYFRAMACSEKLLVWAGFTMFELCATHACSMRLD